jgi:ABC-type spermidine/putrescine transport system permease subunit I
LPRRLVLLGYAIAVVLLLSVSFFKLLMLLLPLWVAAWVATVSIVILLSGQGSGPSAANRDRR